MATSSVRTTYWSSKGNRMIPFWRHNESRSQWELVIHNGEEGRIIGVVTDDMLTSTILSEDQMMELIVLSYPDWPPFPNKARRDQILAKHDDLSSFPAGSRNNTDAPKAEDGWMLGGRKDEDLKVDYDPSVAAHHQSVHQRNSEN